MPNRPLAAALALAVVAATAFAALYLVSDDPSTAAYYSSEPLNEPASPLDFTDDATDPAPFDDAGKTKAPGALATREVAASTAGPAFSPIPPSDEAPWFPPMAPTWKDDSFEYAQPEDFEDDTSAPAGGTSGAEDETPLPDAERAVADALASPPPLPEELGAATREAENIVRSLPGLDSNSDPLAGAPDLSSDPATDLEYLVLDTVDALVAETENFVP